MKNSMRFSILYSLSVLMAVLLSLGSCSDPTAPGTIAPEQPAPAPGFVLIPAGSFVMGSPENEPARSAYEVQHPVTLTHSFWMKSTEVTNEEYRLMAQWALDRDLIELTGDTIVLLRDKTGAQNFLLTLNAEGSELRFDAEGDTLVLHDAGFGINPYHPVKYLSWWGAAAYCDWLSMKEGREPAYDHTTWEVDHYNTTGYRLPTEAEWEYAARGGTQTAFAGHGINALGCEADSLASQAWYCFNASDWPRPVRQLLPNSFGLYDMHGNVWEFCNDLYLAEYYSISPIENPIGAETSIYRVTRGGNWKFAARFARAAQRGVNIVGQTSDNEGFRPVLIKTQN